MIPGERLEFFLPQWLKSSVILALPIAEASGVGDPWATISWRSLTTFSRPVDDERKAVVVSHSGEPPRRAVAMRRSDAPQRQAAP